MKLETQRLILRCPEQRDVDDYMEFCNTEFVLRFNAMTPKNRDQMLARFTGPQDGSTLLLEHKQTGKVIGEIGIEEDSVRWDVASRELTYLIAEDYSCQGYMKEALQALIRYLFETENLECVAARCFAPNAASLALLKSLGFTQDGYIPRCVRGYGGEVFDDTLHSLFRKDYQ